MVVVRGAEGSALTRCVSVFGDALADDVGSMGSHGLLSIMGARVKSCSFNWGKFECCALVGFNGVLLGALDSVVDFDICVVDELLVDNVVVTVGIITSVVFGSIVVVVVVDFSVVVCMIFSRVTAKLVPSFCTASVVATTAGPFVGIVTFSIVVFLVLILIDPPTLVMLNGRNVVVGVLTNCDEDDFFCVISASVLVTSNVPWAIPGAGASL